MLERGDVKTAEGAIAQAIEDGIPATTLHGEVIAPALARIRELHGAGDIDSVHERLANVNTRRVLATLCLPTHLTGAGSCGCSAPRQQRPEQRQ